MIIHRAEYDIETGRLLRMVAEDYCGPWALCKNDQSKKVSKESRAASKEAQAISKAQLAKSNALIDSVTANFAAELKGQGVSDEEVALRVSQFRNNLSQAYVSGKSNLKSMLASRGGYQEGGFGGTDISRIAGFEANQSRSLAAGNLGIKLWANEENWKRKLGAGTLYGAMAGTQAQTATGFGNIGANYMGTAAQAAARADQPSPLWGVLGQVIGAGASVATGGISRLINPVPAAPNIYGAPLTNTNPYG